LRELLTKSRRDNKEDQQDCQDVNKGNNRNRRDPFFFGVEAHEEVTGNE
jgi:hypothetical protein